MSHVALWILALSAALALAAWVAGAPLAATAQAASSGDWQILQEVDNVTGAKLTTVLLPSRKIAHSGLALTPRALLQFACRKGQLLLHLQFGFQIGSKGDSDVSYRFDGRPAHAVKVRILRGLKIMVIENEAEVAQFLDELATANVLFMVINSLAKGRTSAEFRVTGAPNAIAAARAACPGG